MSQASSERVPEMVLRVAEKISDELKLHKQGLDWEDPDGPIQRAARAAIAAIREPTEAMDKAMENSDFEYWSPEPGEGRDGLDMAEAWRAAIDEALR